MTNAHLIAAAPDLLEALKRALELLDATARFMDANPIAAECCVEYDEATCDGRCLADDCLSASEMAQAAIAKAKGRAA